MQLAKYILGFRIKLLVLLNWMFTYSNLINRKYLTDIPSWNIHLCIIVITQSHFTKVYLQLCGFAQVMPISNLLYVIFLFIISLDTFGFYYQTHIMPITLCRWKWLYIITSDSERKTEDASFAFAVILCVFSNWLLISYFPGPGTP